MLIFYFKFFFKTKIKNNYLKKYSLQKSYKPIEINQIKSWSKQILETLNFIHSKGFFYGHLHTGNILIEQNKIKLTDIHNSTLGVPYLYRSFVSQHRKIQVIIISSTSTTLRICVILREMSKLKNAKTDIYDCNRHLLLE